MALEEVGELRDGEAMRNEQNLEEFCMNRPGGSLLCYVGSGRAKGVDKKEADQRHIGFVKCMHRE